MNQDHQTVRRRSLGLNLAGPWIVTLGMSMMVLLFASGCSEKIIDCTSQSFRVTADQTDYGALGDVTTSLSFHDLATAGPAQNLMVFIDYTRFTGEFLRDSLFLLKSTLWDPPDGFKDYYLLHLPLEPAQAWKFEYGPENPFDRDTIPESTLDGGNFNVKICRSTLDSSARMVWIQHSRPWRFRRELLVVPVDSIEGDIALDSTLTLTIYWQGRSQPERLNIGGQLSPTTSLTFTERKN